MVSGPVTLPLPHCAEVPERREDESAAGPASPVNRQRLPFRAFALTRYARYVEACRHEPGTEAPSLLTGSLHHPIEAVR